MHQNLGSLRYPWRQRQERKKKRRKYAHLTIKKKKGLHTFSEFFISVHFSAVRVLLIARNDLLAVGGTTKTLTRNELTATTKGKTHVPVCSPKLSPVGRDWYIWMGDQLDKIPCAVLLGKSGWRNGHQSRLLLLLQMLYVDWVSVNLNLTSRVSSGYSGFLPYQNWLLLYSNSIGCRTFLKTTFEGVELPG